MKSVLNGSTKESFGTVISLYITCVLFFWLVVIFFVRRFIVVKASSAPASTISLTLLFNCISSKTALFIIISSLLMLTSILLGAVLSFSFIFYTFCIATKASMTLASILLGAVISFTIVKLIISVFRTIKTSAINAASHFFIPDHVLVSTVICFIIILAGVIVPTKMSAFLAGTHFVVLFRTFSIKFPISSGVSAE